MARAGLVAALKHDAIPGSARWPVAICRPGPDPLESLAVALSRAVNVGQGAPALAELIAEFQKNEKTLHLIARQSLPENAPDMRLVIVVDQFEEVFTLCRKEELPRGAHPQPSLRGKSRPGTNAGDSDHARGLLWKVRGKCRTGGCIL